MTHPMTIDAEKLEIAIQLARATPLMFGAADPFGKSPGSTGFVNIREDMAKLLADAAEQVLATLPRYKEVEVWHVECFDHGVAKVHLRGTRESADVCAKHASEMGDECVRVTGPHKHRVPA